MLKAAAAAAAKMQSMRLLSYLDRYMGLDPTYEVYTLHAPSLNAIALKNARLTASLHHRN